MERGGVGVYSKKGFEMDLDRLVVQYEHTRDLHCVFKSAE